MLHYGGQEIFVQDFDGEIWKKKTAVQKFA